MTMASNAMGSGKLAGKVAIVTGAASGFGLATVKKFEAEGAKVIAADLNKVALESAFGSSSSIITVVANVTSAEDWSKLLKIVETQFDGLDILVNNAGTSYRNKPTLDVTEDDYDKCFEVNVRSIYLSMRVILPHFIKRGGGAVINIASIGALRPRPGLVWYNASKAAVVNVTKGFAAEFGKHNIRVNAVCPLLSGTGLFESFVGVPFTGENVKKFLGNVPLGRLAEAEDIANACSYLGSDEGKFISGISLEVDGGRSVGG